MNLMQFSPLPTFSIIITSYNQKSFVKEAVESVIAQKGSREIIVVDDGSSDGSLDMLQSYGSAIRLLSYGENKGVIYARNYGAVRATGEYLVFLDGDDALTQDALNVYSDIVDQKLPVVILGSQEMCDETIPQCHALPSEQSCVVEYPSLMKKDHRFRISASSMVIHRQSFIDAGGWTVEIFPVEDVDLLMRLGFVGKTVHVLSPATTYYRLHSNNSIRKTKSFVEAWKSILRKESRGGYPGGLKGKIDRLVFLGGPLQIWLRTFLKAGMYSDVCMLVMRGWPALCAKAIRSGKCSLLGRHKAETVFREVYEKAS